MDETTFSPLNCAPYLCLFSDHNLGRESLNIYGILFFLAERHGFVWKWQTYVAITQAIKELHSGGTSAGRVEYAVSDLDSNPLMSGYSDVECSQCH